MGLINEYKEFRAFRNAVKETGRLEREKQRIEDTERQSKALTEFMVKNPRETCVFVVD